MSDPDGLRTVAATQAAYYALTGLWPLADIESFESITGPKVDRWLVKTVGALVTAIGASLALGARDNPTRPETVVLGAGSAAALGVIDTVYVAKRRISSIYLVDAAAQAAIVAGWIRGRA
jgi:hypothetical protein